MGEVGALGQGAEAVDRAASVVRDHDRPVRQRRPCGHQGVCDIWELEFGLGLQPFGQPGTGRRQSLRAPGRHDQRDRAGRLRQLLVCDGLFGLFQDDVGVRAADAERGDCGTAGAVRLRPVSCLAEELDRSGGPVHVGGRLGEVQGAGQYAVPQGEDRLHDSGDAGGGLGVTDVGLDRAEPQRAFRRAMLAVGGEERLGFDGVAEAGSGAVCLDGVDVRGREACALQRLLDQAGLAAAVGCGEAVGGAVLVDGGASDHGQDGVSVAARVGEALDQQRPHTLGPTGTVRRLVEGLAATVR